MRCIGCGCGCGCVSHVTAPTCLFTANSLSFTFYLTHRSPFFVHTQINLFGQKNALTLVPYHIVHLNLIFVFKLKLTFIGNILFATIFIRHAHTKFASYNSQKCLIKMFRCFSDCNCLTEPFSSLNARKNLCSARNIPQKLRTQYHGVSSETLTLALITVWTAICSFVISYISSVDVILSTVYRAKGREYKENEAEEEREVMGKIQKQIMPFHSKEVREKKRSCLSYAPDQLV